MKTAVMCALMAALATACTAPLSGAPCPCLPGFTCDVALDICRPGDGGSGATGDGGSGDGGEVPDAAGDNPDAAGESDASGCSEPECPPFDAGCPECPPIDAGGPADAGPPTDAGPGGDAGLD